MMYIKLLNDLAKVPTRGSAEAAGYDLYSTEQITIGAGCYAAVGTGFALALYTGYGGFIMPRSGLALKHGIDTRGGLIDSDYRGEVKVILFNDGNSSFKVNVGDRIAQLVIKRVWQGYFEQLEKLPEARRGAGGFGSTGV